MTIFIAVLVSSFLGTCFGIAAGMYIGTKGMLAAFKEYDDAKP